MELGVPPPVGAPVKVLIADDHPLMIAGIRRILEDTEEFEIVGEAESGPGTIEMTERRRPTIVLLDLRLPGATGMDCIEQIRHRWPEVKTVVLSASDDRPSIDAALSAGASAYIVKSVHGSDVASVLRRVARGNVYHPTFSPPHSVEPSDETEGPVLTTREHDILKAAAAGLTTAAISEDLWVSEHTIKFHLTNIYRKLGVCNRAAAIRYALDHGIVAD
jgi:DNA-binding NarL/FixJ family response regulator